MAGPLLETKLHLPSRRPGLVTRTRLSARLNSEVALVLVSAPAGFGKTTLLTEWLAADPRPVAWVSLDAGDNDPVVFWAYLVAALNRATGLALDATTALATLLNALQSLSTKVVLVLDDFHVIESPEVQRDLAFLVEHLPTPVQLVIATRSDPALPLTRMRVRRQLAEIRADDLRFSVAEAAEYLGEVMGLTLTPADAAALDGRTEGWIAALQLAALSMHGRDDLTGFIAEFSGDDRYIVDYLLEEVLQRQSAAVQTFLLHTSILGRLTGPLCDAVTGQTGGGARLRELERANLFLVALDDHRQWYRYHHLFADVLRARLLDEQPERMPELHARASEWFEQNGEPHEAIRHALAGGQFERAADLIELGVPALRALRQEITLLHWLNLLPGDLLAARPSLSAFFAGALLITGQTEGVEARLQDAERWRGHITAAAQEIDVDLLSGPGPGNTRRAVAVTAPGPDPDPDRRSLLSKIAIYRAAQAWALGDVPATIRFCGQALDLVGDADIAERGAASGMLGLAHWTRGDLSTAYDWWAASVQHLRQAGHLSDVAGCSLALGDIRLTQGRLSDAQAAYQRGLAAATALDGSALRGAADMRVGLADVCRERDDLDAAREHLRAGRELGESSGLPQNPYRWRVAMARIQWADGEVDAALHSLDDAERVYVSDFFPNVRPVSAVRARVWAQSGRLNEALAWARERGLHSDDELSYVHEYEHVTLARVLLAEYAAGPGRSGGRAERAERYGSGGPDRNKWHERMLVEATGLLARLLQAAEMGERTGTVIEILVVQALAEQLRGNKAAALQPLGRALALAEAEGYVRIFIEEGAPMLALLRAAATQGVAQRYVRRLLASADGGCSIPTQSGLIEPLSRRELDVLRLLATDLTGPAIARELVVSLNTIRTHIKNIYAKLGVASRRAAVRRAAELGLLARR
ncbi:LuxR C-terminal-related transcriptional regulator [Cryobacterium sp. PH29-G1]|uniref:LuxR C-terminal-related transcriptional regulator n=1 Tax=Cryobacterium sp. PH29-G1 TaxID=3046211 RepID=UPI0024BA27E5|nr:LuxR C-terminal-related transcriptional regulator [Cryobacterium sp. PH29-G1]MDJ0349573.1 LuxR C-terminal-related transcriptional regulator [Cryobacterium sp. PH29-G1]